MAAGWRKGKEGYNPYHLDEQNSTMYITGEKGAIQNSYHYDAFGVVEERQQGIENRILYTGQQYDQMTGQYYLRARYYNPVLGRFLQEDVYRGDGLNLYAYCKNNPVTYYDPSGYDGQNIDCKKDGDSETLQNSKGYNVPIEKIEEGKRITKFDCPDDPIRDILGRGMESNPKDWSYIIKELEDSGVEIVYREKVMAYAPHPSINGKPGQFLIDPDASISALEHEYLHFKQAQSSGFPNMQGAFQDSSARIANETASYAIEIQRAKELGLENVVEQLQKNLQREIESISTTSG